MTSTRSFGRAVTALATACALWLMALAAAVTAVMAVTASTAVAAETGAKLRVGVEGAYPPFSQVDATGELIGFDIDIARALCTQIKAQCSLVQADFDGMIPSLQARKFDMVIASMSITPEREQVVDFSDRYYRTAVRLVARAGSSIGGSSVDNTAATLAGRKIGVQRGTISDRYATAKFAKATVVRYTTQDQAFLDLISGRIDATLCDTVVGDVGFLKTPTGRGYAFVGPEFADPAFLGKGVGIAVRKGDTALRERLNAGIAALRQNGQYQRIQAKYFNFDVYGQ